jgi:hypothetical protein
MRQRWLSLTSIRVVKLRGHGLKVVGRHDGECAARGCLLPLSALYQTKLLEVQLYVGGARCAVTAVHRSQGFGRLSQAKCSCTAVGAVGI